MKRYCFTPATKYYQLLGQRENLRTYRHPPTQSYDLAGQTSSFYRRRPALGGSLAHSLLEGRSPSSLHRPIFLFFSSYFRSWLSRWTGPLGRLDRRYTPHFTSASASARPETMSHIHTTRALSSLVEGRSHRLSFFYFVLFFR
jgi:hypothetical protein